MWWLAGVKGMVDLFDYAREERTGRNAPLAARMRPRTLAEFAGQEHIVGSGTVLRAAVESGQSFSMILFGPPGSGKTTLARLVAAETDARLVQLSAVNAGTADVRAAIQGAREARALTAARTILFIDEIHRFNKAGRLPALCGKRPDHPHRRHDGEPFFRGDRAPAFPVARAASQAFFR